MLLFCSTLLKAQDSQIVMIRKADTISQIEDIKYQSLIVNETVDFDNLIRIYINNSSKIMIDHSMAKPEKVGEIVLKKLKSNIEFNISELNPESIANAKNDLKVLIRKSVLTNKDDFSVMLDQVNTAIWDLMNYCSLKVYGFDYKQLDEDKRKEIRKLIPLNNYLANDVEF